MRALLVHPEYTATFRNCKHALKSCAQCREPAFVPAIVQRLTCRHLIAPKDVGGAGGTGRLPASTLLLAVPSFAPARVGGVALRPRLPSLEIFRGATARGRVGEGIQRSL
ncbi:MAG: hypothetical protein ACYC6A_20440 [Armatimonadota bacterium]